MHGANLERELLILPTARTQLPPPGRVEAGSRDPQAFTHESHWPLAAVASDAGVLHCDSFAKNAAAFFKKSRSIRSRSFSRRNRAAYDRARAK
jgi:hypothetical protein